MNQSFVFQKAANKRSSRANVYGQKNAYLGYLDHCVSMFMLCVYVCVDIACQNVCVYVFAFFCSTATSPMY